MTSPPEPMDQECGDATTIHVRRAFAGDRESLEWVVARLSPLLRAQAHFRLGPLLRQRLEPEDVVAEAWIIALPRLGEFAPESGRATPRLLAFLGRTIVNKVNDHLKRCLRRGELPTQGASQDQEKHGLMDVPADVSGVVTQAVRKERSTVVEESLRELPERD